MLERRLDNAVFRSGMAQTRPQARQMSTHGFFTVNGKTVDIPSYLLKTGDVVAVKENKRSKPFFSNFDKRMQSVRTPSWVSITASEFSFTCTAVPDVQEANVGVDMRAIVEFFTR
jgi:small subunit ribosomal protein S4